MGTTDFNAVQIVKADGSIGTTNKATGNLTTSDAYYSFGGAADKWDETWTAANINHANFGVAVSFKGVGMDINYTTYYLKATNFGFSIPEGATINGILAEVEAKTDSNFGFEVRARVDHMRITVYYTEGAADTCTCTGLNNNWEIDMSDYCNITDACDLGTGTLSFTGEGITRCDAQIDTTNLGDPGAGGSLYILDDCWINID